MCSGPAASAAALPLPAAAAPLCPLTCPSSHVHSPPDCLHASARAWLWRHLTESPRGKARVVVGTLPSPSPSLQGSTHTTRRPRHVVSVVAARSLLSFFLTLSSLGWGYPNELSHLWLPSP